MDLFGQVGYVRMLSGVVLLNTTTTTTVRVGSSDLVDRKWLYIMNASGVNIFIGSQYLDDTGTPQTITRNELDIRGIKMASGDAIWLPVSDRITVYAISQSGVNKRLRVMELA